MYVSHYPDTLDSLLFSSPTVHSPPMGRIPSLLLEVLGLKSKPATMARSLAEISGCRFIDFPSGPGRSSLKIRSLPCNALNIYSRTKPGKYRGGLSGKARNG